jgi:hypothetical protein
VLEAVDGGVRKHLFLQFRRQPSGYIAIFATRDVATIDI